MGDDQKGRVEGERLHFKYMLILYIYIIYIYIYIYTRWLRPGVARVLYL